MERKEYTAWLRTDEGRHHNCCQSVLMSFAEEMGVDREQAYRLGANMGAGMRTGAACGVVTGALIAMGAMGYTEQESRAFLKDFVDRQYGLTPEDRIFPITDRAIQKKMKQKTEQAKLKPIRVHDLRHSHIALLIEKGMQPLVIAQRVGHDSVNTTMNIYGHLYPNKQKQVADLLNAEATGEPESNLVDMATEMRFRKAGGWS